MFPVINRLGGILQSILQLPTVHCNFKVAEKQSEFLKWYIHSETFIKQILMCQALRRAWRWPGATQAPAVTKLVFYCW